MSENQKTGSCMCGAVSFSTTVKTPIQIDACHCSMCRKWSGSPAMSVHCDNNVKFEGGDNISIFSSSEWAERGFCKKCGTHLYWRFAGGGDFILSYGIFDNKEDCALTTEIFIDEKPEWYEFANDTKKLTGEEVAAMFADEVKS